MVEELLGDDVGPSKDVLGKEQEGEGTEEIVFEWTKFQWIMLSIGMLLVILFLSLGYIIGFRAATNLLSMQIELLEENCIYINPI